MAVADVDRRLSVLHLDMDAFYVSVEVQRDPSLRGRPVVVGGTGDRGVVAAASYEARAYGVRSAMPTAVARRRCPDAVFLHGDHARYGEVSASLHEIFASVTPTIEPIALDEAFLDISGAFRLFGDGRTIAQMLRDRIRDELDLSCSVGVARTKLLAKMASEAAKPIADRRGPRPGKGVVVVEVDDELDFLHGHPIRALWGVGPKTHEKLATIGIVTIGDLAHTPERTLAAAVGTGAATHLSALAAGHDDRHVVAERAAKSIGHEETFPVDLHDLDSIEAVLVRLADAVAQRVRAAEVAASTVQLKIRFGDFTTITRSSTPGDEMTTATDFLRVARAVLRSEPLAGDMTARGVRLLGLSGSNLAAPSGRQLSFDELLEGPHDDDVESTGWDEVTEALDDIRARFGDKAIVPGRLAGGDGRVGRDRWGPSSTG